MASINDRIDEVRHWLHEARERFVGARHNLRIVRDDITKTTKELRGIQNRIPHAQGGVLDVLRAKEAKLKEHLKELDRRQKKLAETVAHRREVEENLEKKLKFLKDKKEDQQQPTGGGGNGFATFDGKTVAAWMVPWLLKSRQAGWQGVVVSGVRTPAYSIQLCYNMCGAPSCPGRCAGANSNHNMLPTQGYPYGALDVSDYYNFERIQWSIGSPLRNDLPIDPVHFSVSGH